MGIEFKRGDTFTLPQLVFWEDKAQLLRYPLTGVTIKSQIRKGSTLVDTLIPVITDELNGEFSLSQSASSENWPTGELSMDIEFTLSTGQVISTATVSITCVKDITRNG